MTKAKSTKGALLSSVIALLLCCAMLMGATFAWFTDSASTAVNKIQAGRLDVSLEMATSWAGDEPIDWGTAEGQTLAWRAADGRGDDLILWEPGCTYNLNQFRIVNKGSLALKYKILISGIVGDAKLLEAIEFTVTGVDGAATAIDLNGFEGKLGANAVTGAITISGHMKEDADNRYQGLSIDGIGITVVATQDTVEEDSFGKDYDAGAKYMDFNGLKNALAAGGDVTLAENVGVVPEGEGDALIPQMTVTEDTTLNLQGQTLGVDPSVYEQELSYTPALISVENGSTLTINGNGTVTAEAGYNNSYGIDVNGGNLIINGGSYYGAITAVQVESGSAVINGGFFDLAPTCKEAVPQYAKYVVNCIDSAFKDGTATISITGGTFVNFDPSTKPEGDGTSYVAEGYRVVSETQENGEIWYTVVPKEPVAVNSVEEFTAGLEDGNTLVLGSDLALTANLSVNKNVTVKGNGTASITGYPVYVGATNTVTFSGVNFADTTIPNNASSVYGKGFQGTLIFEDCTFGDSNWESVQVTPMGDATIIFRNCTFTATKDMKRFIHVQPAGSNDFKLDITIVDCVFNGCEKVNYSASDTVSVIDLDYIAAGSALTLGGCQFYDTDGTEAANAHAYFCQAASGGYAETYGYAAMYAMLTGDIQTYTVA